MFGGGVGAADGVACTAGTGAGTGGAAAGTTDAFRRGADRLSFAGAPAVTGGDATDGIFAAHLAVGGSFSSRGLSPTSVTDMGTSRFTPINEAINL